jgi:copper(I)-binding protein
MNPIRFCAAALLSLAAAFAQAHSYKIGAIDIGHPYARATAPGQPTGGGFLKLTNQGEADRLVSASADVSRGVELHVMKMEGDVMRMRQVDAIDVPAGQTVELAPGGLHIMFTGLKAPLKEGTSFPMTLRFEKAGEVTVEVKVEKTQAAPAAHHHKH